jgi:hypothetical protein
MGVLVGFLWWQNWPPSADSVAQSATLAPLFQAVGGERRVVAKTGGIGVRFRSQPWLDAPASIGIPDGTTVFLINQLIGTDGDVWWQVQLEDGSSGYVKDRYLAQP